MNVSCCLAIIAHEKAAPTIADFQPQWQKLNLPIIAFLPEGDRWPGAPVNRVVHHGINAHRGLPVYERFMHCCRTLLTETGFDTFCVMEYDTVNLADELPDIDAAAVNCGLAETWGDGAPPGQVLAFSPWIASRPMMAALLEALNMQLKKPAHAKWVAGLLDRWIGTALQAAGVPAVGIGECMPWCDDSWDMMKLFAEKKTTLAHGWKSKEKFQHLWPKS